MRLFPIGRILLMRLMNLRACRKKSTLSSMPDDIKGTVAQKIEWVIILAS
jgi:hypothetical protein